MADCLMACYDPQKRNTLTVDASPYGLGAILSNVEKVGTMRHVAFASRSLTDVEEKYFYMERDWQSFGGVNVFTFAPCLTYFTDSKALKVIFIPTSKLPALIERGLSDSKGIISQ